VFTAPTMLPAGDHDEVHYTTNCKHSIVLLRMGEIIARNMLNLSKLLIKLLLLHPVGRLYYYILRLSKAKWIIWNINNLSFSTSPLILMYFSARNVTAT